METKKSTPTILKRRYRSLPKRQALFVNVESHEICLEESPEKKRYRLAEGMLVPLASLLETAQRRAIEVIYIIGGWNAESSPPTEWFQAPEEWQRVNYNRNPFIAVYKSSGNGKRISVYSSAQWFGDCADIGLVRESYVRLRLLLQGVFGDATQIMGTPAMTGLDLLERSLPVSKDGEPYEYPMLPDEVRERIEHNIGQGRIEMLALRPDVPETGKLYVLDGVWMYAACCRRVPAPPVQHEYSSEYAGYRVGFYKLQFQVPAEWDHIGLLPTWHPKQKRTVYPFKPGTYWYTSYACADEVRLALDHGWPIKIQERWLFAEEAEKNSDPLQGWISKLRMLRDKCTDKAEGRKGSLLRSAIRAIVIKAIGSMHRASRYQQIETPLEQMDSVPADAEILWQNATHIRWKKPIPLHTSMVQFQHPEWAAYVWGRARKRLAETALRFPRNMIIALRSDAIVLAAHPGEQYHPDKNTKPGQFRLKEVLDLFDEPLPTTNREYLDIRKRNRLSEDDEEE